MKTSSNKIFDDYVLAAKLKNASLRYCFARDVFDQVQHLTEKFDYEMRMIIQNLMPPQDSSNELIDESAGVESLAVSESDEMNPDNTTSKFDDNISDFEKQNEQVWIRHLFKQIAVRCHPDKLMNQDISSREFHFLLSSYETARQALDDRDEPQMICTGIDLKIMGELGADGSHRLLTEASADLENEVVNLRKSTVWIWGSAEDDLDAKTRILCNIFMQLYGQAITAENVRTAICEFYEIESRKIPVPPRRLRRRPGEHPGPHLRATRKNNG